jgi:hypothetical protein
MVEANSMPINAKHITPRPLAISKIEPPAAGGDVATPCQRAAAAAATTRTTVTTLPTPPMLLIHLPTPSPRMFAAVMSASHPKAMVATNRLSSTIDARPSPPAYAMTPAR